MSLRFVIGGLVLATAPPIDVSAAEPTPAPSASHRLELLGDIGGVRPWLDERGAFVQLMYDEFLSSKPAGGGADRDSDLGHSGSYDAFLGVDLQDLVGRSQRQLQRRRALESDRRRGF
jgi:hypothetical protein